jgi:hypothetical protein
MPYSYTIDADRGLMTLRAWGVLTMSQLTDARIRGSNEPNFDRAFATMIDLREVTVFERDRALLRQFADQPVIDKRTRLAILPPARQSFGMANIFAAFARLKGRPVRVFDNAEAAEQWLSAGEQRRAG